MDERVVRTKEKPARPPPPHSSRERDKADWDTHDRRHRDVDTYDRRERDRGHSADRLLDKERQRHKDQHRARTRSRDRGLDEDYYDTSPRWDGPKRDREGRTSWEEEADMHESRARGRRRVESNPHDVFEDHIGDRGRRGREQGRPNGETGSTQRQWVCVVCDLVGLLLKSQVVGRSITMITKMTCFSYFDLIKFWVILLLVPSASLSPAFV